MQDGKIIFVGTSSLQGKSSERTLKQRASDIGHSEGCRGRLSVFPASQKVPTPVPNLSLAEAQNQCYLTRGTQP